MSEFTGNMVIPSPYDVRDGTLVDEGSGNFTLPLIEQVVDGVGFGTSGTEFLGTFVCPGSGQLTDNINLFIRGNISGTPSVGNDNFGITLDQLFKNGDFNPQIIGRFTGYPNTVTIEVWDNNGNIIVLTNNSCYQIGDTGRWAWSTANLSPLTKIINQFIYRMTGDNAEVFESQFILHTRRKNSYKMPENNNHIKKM